MGHMRMETKYLHLRTPVDFGTDIQSAAVALSAIYGRNVFPDLRVTWGTYPSNLGHMDFPGCFRCHDEITQL
jgi:hypothetical protein